MFIRYGAMMCLTMRQSICTLTALYPSSVAPDAIKRNMKLESLAHASQRTGMLVLRRTQIDWRIVKHIIAPYLMNNAGWRDLVPL